MEYYRPMSSSPPVYDEYTPSGSQDPSDKEHPSDDHARKRRKIAGENTHERDMADSSRPPLNPRRTPLPPQYDYLPYSVQDFPPRLSAPTGTFLEEDAALEYLASGSGFAHDLHGIDLNTPSHLPPFFGSNQPSHSAALTSHPSQPVSLRQPGYTSFRHITDDYFFTSSSAPPAREGRQGQHEAPESSRNVTAVASPFDFAFPPPYRAPTYPPNIPVIEGISPPRRTPCLSSTVPDTTPSESPKKPTTTTMLILSRASGESIEALDEHKRECPTCCLEFEPGNFLAVITCCNMAMHARCLSAWVNSQSYYKNKVCMKCRRGIDAKYALNKVMPPVSDKDWDEGGNFDAPEFVKDGKPIELSVTARSHRSRYRSSMGYARFGGGRHEDPLRNLTAEERLAVVRLREHQTSQLRDARIRSQVAMQNSNRLNHEDLDAGRAVVEAQSRASHDELAALLKRCRETRVAREKARDEYEKTRLELDSMERAHTRRIVDMIEEYTFEREARDRAARYLSQMDQPARSAPIPIPQLRVVNGEPSGSVSP